MQLIYQKSYFFLFVPESIFYGDEILELAFKRLRIASCEETGITLNYSEPLSCLIQLHSFVNLICN